MAGNNGRQGWTQEQRERWTKAFRRALEKRGQGKRGAQVHLARAAGLGETLVSRYARGKAFPGPDHAERIALALDTPSLLTLNLEIRTKRCDGCGERYVDMGSGISRWCKRKGVCFERNVKRERQARRKRDNLARHSAIAALKKRNRALRDAIKAECLSCEPDGVCYNARRDEDGDCRLLSVTPLPKVREPDEAIASIRPTGGRFPLVQRVGPRLPHEVVDRPRPRVVASR